MPLDDFQLEYDPDLDPLNMSRRGFHATAGTPEDRRAMRSLSGGVGPNESHTVAHYMTGKEDTSPVSRIVNEIGTHPLRTGTVPLDQVHSLLETSANIMKSDKHDDLSGFNASSASHRETHDDCPRDVTTGQSYGAAAYDENDNRGLGGILRKRPARASFVDSPSFRLQCASPNNFPSLATAVDASQTSPPTYPQLPSQQSTDLSTISGHLDPIEDIIRLQESSTLSNSTDSRWSGMAASHQNPATVEGSRDFIHYDEELSFYNL